MERIHWRAKKHFLVCVNKREKGEKPCCHSNITEQDVNEIKQWLREEYMGVICTKTKCLGFCNEEKGVMASYPEGNFFKVKDKEEIKKIIQQEA